MPITIRAALPADIPAITDILRDLGWFEHLTLESVDITRERITRHLGLCISDASHNVYVAEDSGTILGYVSVHWLPYLFLTGPEGYISELFISEHARGKGIGTRLLNKVKEEGAIRGCSRLALINNRGRESYRRGFYEGQGWTERKEMANFIYKFK